MKYEKHWGSNDFTKGAEQILITITTLLKLLLKYYIYEGVSKSFQTQLIMKYMLTFGITRWEPTQRVMVAKLTTLTHKIVIQLHLVAENCTICSPRSRWPVRKLLDTPSYTWNKNVTAHWMRITELLNDTVSTRGYLSLNEVRGWLYAVRWKGMNWCGLFEGIMLTLDWRD
jgi:hypothetical protein